MIIHLPDPNPGRCLNMRPGHDGNGYPVNRRCLLYENERHICEFPPNPPVSRSGSGQWTSHTEKIEPWVSPVKVPA